MNNEKEIQEFLSKPPYFQMLSVLTSIQENIPENANESLLKIKKKPPGSYLRLQFSFRQNTKTVDF